MIEILVRDPARELQAEITDFGSLDLVLRFNAVSTWTLTLPVSAVPPDLIVPGAGIVVRRDGTVLLAGIWTSLTEDWKADASGNVTDVVTFGGVSDMVFLADRDAEPGAPLWGGTTSTFPTSGGYVTYAAAHASTVLRSLVGDNAGLSAIGARRVPGLVLGTDPLVGVATNRTVRFDPLLSVLQEVALSGGDIGFDVVPDGTNIEFTVFVPFDRSGEVVFSVGMRNLIAYTYETSRPTATHVTVGAQGEGVDRLFLLGDGPDAAVWGRIETFVDRRDTADHTELDAAVVEALAKGAANRGLSISPIDTPDCMFGVHYGLGDLVRVEAGGIGQQAVVDVLREVRLTLDGDGVTVVPSILTPGQSAPVAGSTDRTAAQFVRQRERVHQLEARS